LGRFEKRRGSTRLTWPFPSADDPPEFPEPYRGLYAQ
jgi:hypothetical protein